MLYPTDEERKAQRVSGAAQHHTATGEHKQNTTPVFCLPARRLGSVPILNTVPLCTPRSAKYASSRKTQGLPIPLPCAPQDVQPSILFEK